MESNNQQATNRNFQTATAYSWEEIIDYIRHSVLSNEEVHSVSSNLPYFLIEYDSSVHPRNRTSDVAAAEKIKKYFKQQGIIVSFYLVDRIDNKLKLGVNNKETPAKLMSTDKWMSNINNIKIRVRMMNMPKRKSNEASNQ